MADDTPTPETPSLETRVAALESRVMHLEQRSLDDAKMIRHLRDGHSVRTPMERTL